jgi:hypothetical protein
LRDIKKRNEREGKEKETDAQIEAILETGNSGKNSEAARSVMSIHS